MNEPAPRAEVLRLRSQPPLELELSVEEAGSDLVCRIHGGRAHVGAVALARWSGVRAETSSLTVAGHREAEIAELAARRLCRSARTTVAALAGIHFDSLERAELDPVIQAAGALVRRAARLLEDRRLAAELRASEAFARLEAERGQHEASLREFRLKADVPRRPDREVGDPVLIDVAQGDGVCAEHEGVRRRVDDILHLERASPVHVSPSTAEAIERDSQEEVVEAVAL